MEDHGSADTTFFRGCGDLCQRSRSELDVWQPEEPSGAAVSDGGAPNDAAVDGD